MRNDLGGSLPGMVQFAQNHTVDPSGNEARQMPRLAAQREALVLITPDPALGEIDSLQVTATLNGQTQGTFALRHPNDIPRSDYANTDGRPDYVYSARAWTGVLPWNWVQPGLELRVSDPRGRTGMLRASAIDFGAAAELVVQSVRLGMLTDPEVNNSGKHWFRSNPTEAASDYFQTIPAARITASYYEDVRLSRVMVATGVIYDSKSATNGDVYSGDMRENTGKSTFSVGINLANWGVTSSGMQSQEQPQVTESAVIHHARGAYANGVVEHGLSGGNSILTLSTSRGNEFSHEIGHHYGIGHYPGQNGSDMFWTSHHHDSGWGYIGYRKRMRAGIHWKAAKDANLASPLLLDDTYRFAEDAMSGGNFASSLSNYTHYTGYSTKNWIQPHMNRAVFAPDSPTGYRKWNVATRAMEPFAPPVPNSGNVWYNSATKVFAKPRLFGVPVWTLLGGYDPDTGNALIYPALRGNWGNVFDLPQAAVAAGEPRQCWLNVAFANGSQQRIALAGKRMQTNLVNKLHVNLAQGEQPVQARLLCQAPGQQAQELYSLAIPQGLPAMPAPAIVGKDAGYSALRQVELPRLDAALQALAGKKMPNLSGDGLLLYESWGADTQGLSPAARNELARYAQQQQQGLRLNRWIAAYAADLDAGVPAAQGALMQFLQTLGLDAQPVIPAGTSMAMANGNCIQKVGNDVRVAGKALCQGGASEAWVLDGRGSIRSRADLGQCLTDQGGSSAVRLTPCDVRNDAQVWDTSTPRRIARGGRCLDLNGGYLTNNVGTLITYGCSGGGNQQWGGLVASDAPALSFLTGDAVRRLESAVAASATRAPARGR